MDGLDMITLYKNTARDVRNMADDYAVKIVAHTFVADLDFPTAKERAPGLDLGKQGIENALILGAPCVMVITPPKKGGSGRTSRKNWIAGLNDLAAFAGEAGIVCTVENFPGKESPFVIADDFLEAATAIPALRLTYDNGNCFTGEDPVESFRKSAWHVVHAHFKDWDVSATSQEGYTQMKDGRYYKPALIGEGVMDHKSCLEAMKECNYEGYINIEYEGNKYPAAEALKRILDYLRAIE